MVRWSRPNRPRYIRVRLCVRAAMADEAAGLLVARGALGCFEETPFRGGARRARSVRLAAFFNRLTARELRSLTAALSAARMLANPRQRPPGREQVADPGWATAWMERFAPLRIGRRLLIVPPWSAARDPCRLRLTIKPAQAFGTGHHPSTRGVLLALESLCAGRRWRRGLDVGCGSGILALAMRGLGVARAVGIDPDPAAIENARENTALNGLDGLRFSTAPAGALRGRFDLITANITSGVLKELAPTFRRLIAPHGVMILSGILKRESGPVLQAYAPALRCLRSLGSRGWTTLVLGR